MANWSDPQGPVTAFPAGATDARASATDAGLRSYMLKVYNYMFSGILLTGIVAMLFVASGAAQMAFSTPLRWVLTLAPLAFIFFFNANRSESTLKIMFWAFSVVMGLSLSVVFLIYTGQSIALTFFAVAAAFAGLSLYGYTTKRNLSGWGTFLMMGVVGLFVAMLLNIGIGIFTGAPSPALHYAISAIGVLIFAGLTAYDTQMIKNTYYHVAGSDMMGKAVILGALNLYLDFINMFQFLLSFLGDSD
jgi:uncharacterized protein